LAGRRRYGLMGPPSPTPAGAAVLLGARDTLADAAVMDAGPFHRRQTTSPPAAAMERRKTAPTP
jgi:hypothetical protein